jgi:hypothetical protein
LLVLYHATLLTNLHLALQSQNPWAGFTKDTQQAQILLLAPNDRWAVLSGPRNLLKMVTTGSHIDQRPSWLRGAGPYLLVAVVLSASLLQGATVLDGTYIVVCLALIYIFTKFRASNTGEEPVIRRVKLTGVGRKTYGRRAELVTELSQNATSDAWAYESGLLTRRFNQCNDEMKRV